MEKIKVAVIFGTRPEAIKMVPIVKKLEADARFTPIVIVTAQHREMLDQVLDYFAVKPDYDLNIMKKQQSLNSITVKVLTEVEPILHKEKPQLVLVHGDTTTTFAAALAAFYEGIQVGHVEAGLRTWDVHSPFPEEMNRQTVDVLADYYFAPTDWSKQNLLKENRAADRIFVTGNTVIDAIRYTVQADYHNEAVQNVDFSKKVILLTMHRRENLGQPMEAVFRAVKKIVTDNPDVEIIFPVHKNPRVRKIANQILANVDRIHLIEPLDVFDFHNIMSKCYLVMSDSGGVQEEAPHFGIPVLVLRKTTERPEGIKAGTLKLVGTDYDEVLTTTQELLHDAAEYHKMSRVENPYGDGFASERILDAIAKHLGESSDKD